MHVKRLVFRMTFRELNETIIHAGEWLHSMTKNEENRLMDLRERFQITITKLDSRPHAQGGSGEQPCTCLHVVGQQDPGTLETTDFEEMTAPGLRNSLELSEESVK